MSQQTTIWSQPGEHHFTLQGPQGELEGILSIPEEMTTDYVAVICHPHSLHGGTMQNKVVTTVARAYREFSIASVRFNFRSVGKSAGTFDDGVGEVEDLRAVMDWVHQHQSTTSICLAGFSFGSYVAYQASRDPSIKVLITLAPAVHHYDYQSLPVPKCPWIVVQGEEDEIVPAEQVFAWLENIPDAKLLRFPKTGHFFHGQLVALRQQLQDTLKLLLFQDDA